MKPRALLVILLATLLVAACVGGPGASGSGPRPPAAADLEGRTFLSTGLQGHALVTGSRVRLSFSGGQVAVQAGCNSMAGHYTIVGGRLTVAEWTSTAMGCDPALMAQDTWLTGLLDGADLTLDGNALTATKAQVQLTLLDRVVADPDRPLVGPRWAVDTLLDGDVASSVPSGAVAALVFADGRVTLDGGCNHGGGAVTITATTITFEPLTMTLVRCSDEVMSVEEAVTAVLSGQVDYTIEAASLTLRSGSRGLVLHTTP